MSYRATQGGVIRLSDNAVIPADPRNGDYREYLIWIGKGNVAEPEIPEPPQEKPRDVLAEMDALKDRLDATEEKLRDKGVLDAAPLRGQR